MTTSTIKAPVPGGTIDTDILYNALQSIKCADLLYKPWLEIGMGLKDAGCPCAWWDEWSAQDAARYQPGECERRWATFHGEGIHGGTVIHYAKQAGWVASTAPTHTRWTMPPMAPRVDLKPFLSQFETKPAKESLAEEVPSEPAEQLRRYLCEVFEPTDKVCIIGDAYIGKEERLKFTKGATRTRDEWMAKDITGFNTHGGWCAANAVDGKGRKAENVTRFKHTLIESDTLPIADQECLLRKLNLPITTLTHSAGKSLHALVKIDAKDRQQYDERVRRLHDACNKAGLKPDGACKDPGRLTRLPGVMRGDALQHLVAVGIGAKSWNAWIEEQDRPRIVFTTTRVSGSGPTPTPIFHHGPGPGAFGLVIGEGGVGKGYCALDLLLSCSIGRPVNLKAIHHDRAPMRTLYLSYEDPAPWLEYRMDKISELAGIDPGEWRRAEADGLLNFKADDELAPLFVQRGQFEVPEPTGYLQAVEAYIVENKIRLMVIDPLASATVLVSENGMALNTVAVSLRSMATRTGCTTLLSHHVSKMMSGNSTAHAARGSTALPDAARWTLSLAQERQDAPLLLSISKNSYGPRLFGVPVIRTEHGALREQTQTDREIQARELMTHIINWITDHPATAINFKAIRTKKGTAAELVDAVGARPLAVFDAADEAVKQGYLEIVVQKDAGRNTIHRLVPPAYQENDDDEIPFG